MRLFVAVTPPPEVMEVLQEFPRRQMAGLRWTTEDQWHVTVRFLGEVEDASAVKSALAQVPDVLASSGITGVEATMGPTSAWFSGRHILQVPVGGIEALAHVISEVTSKLGEPPDPRPYAGHLTLARVRGKGHGGPADLAGAPIRATWHVEEVDLFSSTLDPAGSHYERLASQSLGA